ncbi:MAG: HD domain-containing protein [Patescibacteria group bacterium]|nr:HD domain-containing protein [Patescibacteria group bacterium]
MNKRKVIQHIARTVRLRLRNEGTGHDWWHVYRVWKMTQRIGKKEGVDLFVVELAALLHDLADWKFHSAAAGPRLARQILSKRKVPPDVTRHVCEIISTISFKGVRAEKKIRTLEGKVVQDADRLDALGAIGIARAFAVGGYLHRSIYIPTQKPSLRLTKKATLNGTTINHFYEKLLLLKDRMHTRTAKNLAGKRHAYMETYVKRFFQEWDGKI